MDHGLHFSYITCLEIFKTHGATLLQSNPTKHVFQRFLLQKTYRPGAWQIGQLIHHLADSHIHVYTRFKLTLTLDTPTVLDYDHDQWAQMPDAVDTDVESSLLILKGIHNRWAALIETLDSHQWERQYYHPARDKFYPLATVLALYAWHGKHHLAHIKNTP